MPVGSGTSLGWGALLAYGAETTWGTRVTATSALEFRSQNFSKEIEEEILESLGTGRAPARRVQKNISIGGTLAWDLHPVDGISLLKHALMGTVTSAQVGVTGSYNHTFSASDMSTIAQKGLSFEFRPGSETTTAFFYYGFRVNSLKISAVIGEPIHAEIEVIGKDATTGAFFTSTVSYSPVRPFMFQDVTYSMDGTQASITTTSAEDIVSFEFELNNNLQTEDSSRSLGNQALTALPPGRREIKVSVTQRYDTTTAWNRFLSSTSYAIRFRFDTGITIGSTAGATTYSMFIDLPKVFMNTPALEVSDSGILTHEFEVSSIADTTTNSGTQCIVTVSNSATSY